MVVLALMWPTPEMSPTWVMLPLLSTTKPGVSMKVVKPVAEAMYKPLTLPAPPLPAERLSRLTVSVALAPACEVTESPLRVLPAPVVEVSAKLKLAELSTLVTTPAEG